jgi:uncharacterized membrane protein
MSVSHSAATLSMLSSKTFRAKIPSLVWSEGACWTLVAIYLAMVVGYAWKPTPFAQILAAIGIISAFAHATWMYGLKSALAFLAICLAVAFALENLGSSTGVLFGRYHFAIGAQLPHVGIIPVIVGPLWFGMGYFAWVVAATLLGGADQYLNRQLNVLALPLVAAFVMTQWDFVMDAPESTIAKAWIWHDGGADFGVPLTNYMGWLLTSWIFYQAFAFYLSKRGDVRPPGRNGALRLAAILFYACSGFTHLTPWLLGQHGEVADATGYIWRVQDLRETAVAVMLFTTFFTSMLAALRLARDDWRPAD